jgi:DNA-directed RNA polymerase subunit RPC12/RpoP
MLVVSFLSGLAVLIVIIIPVSIGHIAYRIFGKRNARCPACNSKEFIPASTPKAKSIIKNKG